MKGEVTHVGLADGRSVPLGEYPCNHCGKVGVTHLTVSESAPTYAFCSWDCLHAAIRIDDQPITEELMRAAGMHVIGPRPEA